MTIPFVDIAIIGGGPGGLALAQGLRKHGIDVAVYERDPVRADYVQGFRLGLRQRGLDALEANLPPHLLEAFLGTLGYAPSESLIFDEYFHPLAAPEWARGPEDRHGEKSVSRITLRQILLSGLDDIVHVGRVFDHYAEQADGTVVAHFTDGSAVRANVLVGADGANSAVRRQLLPDFRIVDTGMRRLAGKMTLDAAARHAISPLLLDYRTSIRPTAGRRIMFSAHRVDPAAYARFGLIGQDDATHRDIAGFHFDNTTSYVWWNTAYALNELATDAELARLDGAGLIELLLRHVGHWDERIVTLIRNSDPSTVAMLKVRTSEPGAVWETGPVTLLGDAIHSMTYFQALGGNSALHDAGLLAAQLVAARNGGKPLLPALHDYEEAMREHGYEAVRTSLSAMLRNAAADPVSGSVAAA
ncbi:FAD-dependent monooxygenase [Sphingobium sufflavum]|uniref:FAD-dependent oxidoreductase n=1 Tax=Sphingobium sufflavum TaxID=1129547 RepID=UPI001F1EA15F|nr:FAD-dependent monooxygenase [Sphingobium sufflavum]MCE7796151.1 FAD-dependent monooxygenase [Sphingobium sufflavum]